MNSEHLDLMLDAALTKACEKLEKGEVLHPYVLTMDKNTFIEFENPKFAIAPGQSIVFYSGNTCIGGGYIETRSNKNIS